MKFSTSKILVPVVLVAAGVCVAVFWPRHEEPKPVDPASPASYMHDKAFLGDLAAQRAQQSEIIRSRNEVARKMTAMIEVKKAELKTDDVKKVEAELEKDPAWRELYAQCTNANERILRNRREMLNKVRARLTPQKQVPQKVTPQGARPQKVAPQNARPQNVAPQNAAPRKQISK